MRFFVFNYLYIKENLILDSNDNNYPNIDHKISIYEGFINNISVYEIANINNLCVTKRIHNLRKNIKTENDFKIILKNELTI